MKLAVISDLHLTNSLPYTNPGDSFRKDRLEEYLSFFFQKIEEQTVDFLIIPGDLCHRTVLDSDDVDLLLYVVNKIIETGIRTVILLGNHDLDQNKSILSFLNRTSKKYRNIMYYDGSSYAKYVFDNITFDTINFCSHSEFTKRTKFLLRNDSEFSVLVLHIGVKGTLHGTTKSIIGVKKEDIERLSEFYDLIILGHHHKFQWVTDKCFYAGAAQQTRIDERNTVPGGLIVSLPGLKIKKIVNSFSPRFKLVEDYKIIPKEIEGSIVKPIVDTDSVSEEDNLKFLEDIAKQNPYYLIKPRIKKTFLIKGEKNSYSVDNKRKALIETMKGFSFEKKDRKEFYEHTLNIYEKVRR